MKFSKNNSLKIILIGAGGTGGYIAPHLYRIAYASGRKVQIIIADGDIVEKRILYVKTLPTVILVKIRHRFLRNVMPVHSE